MVECTHQFFAMPKIFNAMSGYADEDYINACFIQVYWDIDTGPAIDFTSIFLKGDQAFFLSP